MRTITINGRAVQAEVTHDMHMTTLVVKCDGKMKEMFEDKAFIRSLGQYASAEAASYQQGRSVEDDNKRYYGCIRL